MNVRIFAMVVAAILLGMPTLDADAKDALGARVMTRNLYIGADVFDAINVPPADVPDAAGDVLAEIVAADFPGRAELLADEIRRRQPQAVGLQEVWNVQAQSLVGGPPINIDFLEILKAALADRGQKYSVAVVQQNLDLTLLANLPDPSGSRTPYLGTVTDRDVILVRHNVAWANPAHGAYATVVPVPSLGFDIVRGWTSVDVVFAGNAYRFFNTHLEVQGFGDRAVQTFQAAEIFGILATLRMTYGALPEIVVGDFNSDPDDPPCGNPACLLFGEPVNPYLVLADPPVPFGCRINPAVECFEGLGDIWYERNNDRNGTGATCCHDPLDDTSLSGITRRIDLIWTRGSTSRGTTVRLEGDDPRRRTEGGLFPSDHLGVFGRLTLIPGD
jgi:hypothetical protein